MLSLVWIDIEERGLLAPLKTYLMDDMDSFCVRFKNRRGTGIQGR